MTLQERLRQLLERDPQLRAVREKIRAGTATFSDTARYTARAADILGDILGSSIQDIQQGQREALLTALMQERYDDTFALLEAVQKELDAKQGIRIDPQKADYPKQRIQRAGRKADDPETSEETLRRIAEAVFPNIALSFHDDYMAKNAQFRSRLGLQCHITRTGGANCCDWCAGVEGRYLYQERPADIFRRHDNCKCDIIYETQKGTTQLLRGKETADGRSSKSWQIAVETYGFHPVSYRGKEKPKGFVPVRYTAATAPQGFAPTVLTGGQNPAIIIAGSEGMFRKSRDGKTEPMPKKQFQRIVKRFKAQGGVIQFGEETDQYLAKKHAEAITYDAHTILILQHPGRASVFEELIHTAQYRNGENDGSYVSRLRCEISAQEKLLRNAKFYCLTESEIIQTQKALEAYQQELEEYLKNGGA